MSNSGYDPFDYGLIKPESDDEQTSTPKGDPEDMLFGADSGDLDASTQAYDPGPLGSGPSSLDSAPGSKDSDEPGSGEPAVPALPDHTESFVPAPPPAFREATQPQRRKRRSRQPSIGAEKPIEVAPKPSSEEVVAPPPWLKDDKISSRRIPAKVAKSKPTGRIAVKVASPGAAHRRRAKSGKWLLPVAVLTVGLGVASYLYWILERPILAGLSCAISLIGSMFCGVLQRNKS